MTRMAMVDRFGLSYTETGKLTLWQYNLLADTIRKEQEERARESKARDRGQKAPPGTKVTSVMD